MNNNNKLLNYDIRGKGEPVVLLHGLFGSLENLGVVARQLQESFQVISIDLPDHGKSPHSDTFSFDTYAKRIINTIDSLGIHRPHILGHSLGGKIAMQIALSCPEKINKLIVADIAPVEYAPRHQNVFAALTSFNPEQIKSRQEADKNMSQYVSESGVRQFLLKSLYKRDEEAFAWRFNLNMLHRDYALLSEGIDSDVPYKGEVMFIKGGNSDYITKEHQEKIQRLFPNVKAKIIASTGHWLHAEKPFVFSGIVAKFLEEPGQVH